MFSPTGTGSYSASLLVNTISVTLRGSAVASAIVSPGRNRYPRGHHRLWPGRTGGQCYSESDTVQSVNNGSQGVQHCGHGRCLPRSNWNFCSVDSVARTIVALHHSIHSVGRSNSSGQPNGGSKIVQSDGTGSESAASQGYDPIRFVSRKGGPGEDLDSTRVGITGGRHGHTYDGVPFQPSGDPDDPAVIPDGAEAQRHRDDQRGRFDRQVRRQRGSDLSDGHHRRHNRFHSHAAERYAAGDLCYSGSHGFLRYHHRNAPCQRSGCQPDRIRQHALRGRVDGLPFTIEPGRCCCPGRFASMKPRISGVFRCEHGDGRRIPASSYFSGSWGCDPGVGRRRRDEQFSRSYQNTAHHVLAHWTGTRVSTMPTAGN